MPELQKRKKPEPTSVRGICVRCNGRPQKSHGRMRFKPICSPCSEGLYRDHASKRKYDRERWRAVEGSSSEEGWVYLVEAKEVGAIKIGFSLTDPKNRMRSMQTGNPFTLSLLGVMPGGRKKEKELHDKFAPDCLRGEWFRYSDALAGMVSPAI